MIDLCIQYVEKFNNSQQLSDLYIIYKILLDFKATKEIDVGVLQK